VSIGPCWENFKDGFLGKSKRGLAPPHLARTQILRALFQMILLSVAKTGAWKNYLYTKRAKVLNKKSDKTLDPRFMRQSNGA
jgi:hypothetical protein